MMRCAVTSVTVALWQPNPHLAHTFRAPIHDDAQFVLVREALNAAHNVGVAQRHEHLRMHRNLCTSHSD